MNQPYISVIVTAYNRRRYLPFALRSLEAQTLPRDKFEVIVVKNFDDKESDSIISRNGWKDVYNDDHYHSQLCTSS
ncbi:MAG: glycosyltransferase [Acidilobus sp.]